VFYDASEEEPDEHEGRGRKSEISQVNRMNQMNQINQQRPGGSINYRRNQLHPGRDVKYSLVQPR
jgi:hypothetical protein